MKHRIPFREKLNPFTTVLLILFASAAVFFACITYQQGMIVMNHLYEKTTQGTPAAARDRELVREEKNPWLQEETVLKETEDAGREYLDSMLFFGDSNTVRYLSFTDEAGLHYTSKKNTAAVVGMGVQAIDSLKCMVFKDGRRTMVETAAELKPRRILIMMGTNNLHGTSTDASQFISVYESKLKKICAASPDSGLIVNAIPLRGAKSKYTTVHIEQIRAYNEAILQMCERNGWKYLNSTEALIDEKTGYAKKEYIEADGIHLNRNGVSAMFRYIRTHAWAEEDGFIGFDSSEVVGPITSMYSDDPLK